MKKTPLSSLVSKSLFPSSLCFFLCQEYCMNFVSRDSLGYHGFFISGMDEESRDKEERIQEGNLLLST
jgi:hypothetical protein